MWGTLFVVVVVVLVFTPAPKELRKMWCGWKGHDTAIHRRYAAGNVQEFLYCNRCKEEVRLP